MFEYMQEQCADCWGAFPVREMEYDFVSDEWLCDECFEERKSTFVEKDQDEI